MSTAALAPWDTAATQDMAATNLPAAHGALLEMNASAGYRDIATLRNVVLQLHPGERLGVVGSSGAGKSTLAMAMMGLLPWRGGWAKGNISFHGKNLLALSQREWRGLRGKQIALVPQSPSTALNPYLSLQTHFEEVWRAHTKEPKDMLRCRMHTLLERVGLPIEKQFLNRKPGQVSIGQAQRVLIALALLHRPQLLIADEPTSALDACNQAETLRLLHELSVEYRMGLLYISHDLVSVLQTCERMLVLDDGAPAETLRCDALHSGAEYHVATQRLLQTLPVPPEVLRRHSM